MKISFVDFRREWKFFESKFISAFKKFGQSGIYVLGPEVEKFENNFAKYSGYKYAVGVSTGLSALEMILRAYNIGKGDEVITVPNSAVATALAISNVGAKPVFCDIGDDFLIDSKKIAKLINKKTKAIIPVHLFGKICDLAIINKIAQKNHLVVIEDACQAHGSKFKGESLINTKAFSFYPTKNLGAFGEGGAVVTNDKKISDFVVSYRNYGQYGRYNHIIKGVNGRIDPLQCILMNIKLKVLNKFIERRRNIARNYVSSLKKIDGLVINDFDATSSYHQFVVRVLNGKRDELKNFLEKKGTDALIHYPTLINKQPCYIKEYSGLKLEVADRLQTEILSLPCYPFLLKKEQDQIIAAIKEFFL